MSWGGDRLLSDPPYLRNNIPLERLKANVPHRQADPRGHFLRSSEPLLSLERTNKNSKTDPHAVHRDRLTVAQMISRFASRCSFLGGASGSSVIPAMLLPQLTLTRARALLQTQVQYADNLFLFCDYLDAQDVVLTSVEDLDYSLSYFGHLYQRCATGSKSYYGNILSSIGLFFPRLKTELPTAWATFAGWTSVAPSTQRLPMPTQVLRLMIEVLCARSQLKVAAMLWTGFHTWCRRDELGSMRGQDYLVQERDSTDAAYGVFRLPDNKAGLVQSVTVTDENLHLLLMRMKSQLRWQSDRLFVTGATLEKHLLLSADRLGFPEFRFTPHSLRHGGATAAILRGMAADDVRLRGRWANLSTVLRYVQSGIVAKIVSSLPAACLQRARELASINPLTFFAKGG